MSYFTLKNGEKLYYEDMGSGKRTIVMLHGWTTSHEVFDPVKEEISKYEAQHEADSRRLRELKRNPKAIEKIARERYFMKADDEDIYVLSGDLQQTTQADETAQ